MTLQADAAAIGEAIEIAIWVASFLFMLVAALIVYLMVRPPRHARRREPGAGAETLGAAEMARMMDVMERRLDLLEREIGREGRPRMTGPEPVQDQRGEREENA